MGRNRKVPLKNGQIVNANRVGTDANTPHHPRDVDKAVCQRLFGQDFTPEYKDKGNG